jgi:uncharacterized protein YycO
MNSKTLIALAIAVALAAGTLVWAQANKPTTGSSTDAQLQKLIEQNEQILQKQDEILKQLGEMKTDLNVLRRRSS